MHELGYVELLPMLLKYKIHITIDTVMDMDMDNSQKDNGRRHVVKKDGSIVRKAA